MATSIAKRQLDAIEEQWRANHLEAMSCRKLEDVLLLCIETFERIGREEEEWRLAVLTGQQASGCEEPSYSLELYSLWAKVCPEFLERVSFFEARGYVVEHSERFRACLREAQGILTSDAEFFRGDGLVQLCDEAIDEFRRGETEHVDGPG